ncbi:MAG: P-type conjugative transfer protein TrbL [Pseudomonadota bacterium]
MTRKTALIIGALLVGLLFAVSAHAAIDSNGVLDNVLGKYWQAASQWSSILTSAAKRLFWSLVVISMVWTFGMMLLRKADIGEFFAEFVRFTIFTGFFWWLLTNGPVFANSIIQSLTQLGSTASGLGNSFLPSSIVDVGFGIFGKVIDGSKILEPIDSAIGIIIALIILFILALIGINMLLLMVAAWILAYAGIFFLGFGGSRWTSDMAVNYYKTVLGLAGQIMTVILLVGIGKTIIDNYYNSMDAGITLKDMAVMLIVSLVLLELVNKVPHLIGGIANGSSLHGPGVGSHGAAAGLGMMGLAAAAAMTGGSAVKAGLTSIGGGASAVMAAVSKGSQNVAAGTDILSGFGGQSSTSGGSTGSSGSNSDSGTPLAKAAGFSGSSSVSTSSQSGQSKGGSPSRSAGTAGRVAVDAVANLARGTKDVTKNKFDDMKGSAMQAISENTGGKIAAAIRRTGSDNEQNRRNDMDSEISGFRDGSE